MASKATTDLLKGAKAVTSGALAGTGDTLNAAGASLNDAADKIEGDGAPPPKSVVEDSIRVNLVTDGKIIHGGFYMKLSRLVRDEENLSSLRNMIAGSTERKDVALLDFCSKSGIVVPDTYSIKDYINECLKPAGDIVKDGILDMFLKTALKKTGRDPVQQDSDITEGQYIDSFKLAKLRSEFDDRAFKLLTGTFFKYPAQLEEQDWSVVAENNALCYGNCIVRRREGGKMLVVGIERARYPAFRLKKRNILSDRLTSKTVKDVMFYLRIPDFVIDDQSFVSIYETSSHLQSSLAELAYTSTDVSAAASGSLFGFSMSASASYGQSSSETSETTQESSRKQVTIAYNFPRVTALMDENSLELTMECQKDLAEVKDTKSLTKFLENYGEFFSSRVQLGGRLFATEDVQESSSSESKTEETKKSMKAAASASFYGASVSVSAAHENNASKASTSAASHASSSITWQARGGDTLLCHDPLAWCPTVGDYYYWRITKQDKVLHLVDFIGKLAGFEKVPQKLEEWRKQAGKFIVPQKFFLNRADRSPLGRFLEAKDPVDCSLQRAATCLMQTTGQPTESTTNARLYGMGACCFGNWTRTQGFWTVKWEVETEDGENVDLIHYETPYRLRHPYKGYVHFDLSSAHFLYMSNVKNSNSFVLFRQKGGDKKVSAMSSTEQNKDVTLHFVTKDSKEEEGFIYIACEEPGTQYLSVSPGPDAKNVSPTVMRLRFTDKLDEQER